MNAGIHTMFPSYACTYARTHARLTRTETETDFPVGLTPQPPTYIHTTFFEKLGDMAWEYKALAEQ